MTNDYDVKIKNAQLNKLLHESYEKIEEEFGDGVFIKILVNNTWISGTVIGKKGLLLLLEVDDLSFSGGGAVNLVVDVNDISAFGYFITDESDMLGDCFDDF